jgi:Acetoacetate decarboxylase (ADC)
MKYAGVSDAQGFTVPKSPFGQAALTPPPPWHYSSDVVGVEFWADPKAAAATLPRGLSPDPKSNGHAIMMFLDWQFTAQDDEFLDPARYQYREAFVLLDAMYGDMPVMWCPYIYVDNDAALARGWTQGFPKKMGSIFQTRSFAAASAAAAPVVPGGRFGASLSAHGERLAEACITLRKPVENGLSLLTRPTVLLRYFPRLAAGYHDKPAVDELAIQSRTILPSPTHGWGRASSTFRTRKVKNCTRLRRNASNPAFAIRSPTPSRI